MTLTDKLLKIQSWTFQNFNYPTNSLNEKTDKSLFENIESLLEEKFDIDTNKYGISYMVAFGYRKRDPEYPKVRRKLEDIITWKK